MKNQWEEEAKYSKIKYTIISNKRSSIMDCPKKDDTFHGQV